MMEQITDNPTPDVDEHILYIVRLLHMSDMECNGVYRVMYRGDGLISISAFGMIDEDDALLGLHKNLDAIPEWMQGKLAILHMVRVDPEAPDIPGVGRRIHERIFWVTAP